MWWRWYSWICPVAYTLYGLIATQFGDIDDKVLIDVNQTVKEFIDSYFGFKHDNVWIIAVVIVAFTLVFAFSFALSIRVFNFQKR